MLNPVTIRFTRAMMDMIETVMAERIDGADKGQVIRELVLEGPWSSRKGTKAQEVIGQAH